VVHRYERYFTLDSTTEGERAKGRSVLSTHLTAEREEMNVVEGAAEGMVSEGADWRGKGLEM